MPICSGFLHLESVSSTPFGSLSYSVLPMCRMAETRRKLCSFSSELMLSTSMALVISSQSFSSLMPSTVVTPLWFV